MLTIIVPALMILFFILFMAPILKASESSLRTRNLRRLVLKYDLHAVCVEYEPGNDLLFSNPNATLTMELIKTGNGYVVNLTVDVRGLGLFSKDFAENKSSTYKESAFRRCATFEYDPATERFYWQGKDVGVLLPLFQPLEDRIILFNAEFIPLGTLEPKISNYPPPSPVWASKTFTTLVYLKEDKVCIPELNRTWWISGLNVKPPIWELYEKISRISGNDVLEIIHYGNDTIWSMPSVSIERNTGIIMSIRMPGPTRTSNNTRITVNDKPVNELPVALLPYLLGLRSDIHLYLRSIEAYD
ncbi:MAG: hypothetical protein QXI42_03825 [Thermoproteota archaeon]